MNSVWYREWFRLPVGMLSYRSWWDRIGSSIGARLFLAILLTLSGADAAEGPVIDSFGLVKALSKEEAAQGITVQVRATVIFAHPTEGWFVHFFHDGTDGIYVQLKDWVPDLSAGDQVLLSGITAPGDYAPIIADARVERMGETGPPPKAVVPTSMELARGVYDSQWLQVDGAVRAVRWDSVHVVMELIRDNYRFQVTVPGYTEEETPRHYIGSRVQIQGVYATLFNPKRQLVGFQFYVPGPDYVELQRSPIEDPFALDPHPIAEMLAYQRRDHSNDLVRCQGIVQLVSSDHTFYLSDGEASVRVDTIDPHALQVGDQIDAVGFAELGGFSPKLVDCRVRKDGEAEKVSALSASVAEAMTGVHEARLVTLAGRLVSRSERGSRIVMTLQELPVYFDAEILGGVGEAHLQEIEVGSLVKVTGVCVVEVDTAKTPIGFHLLVGDASEVRVLERPSWWNLRNTLMVIGSLVLVVVAISAWGLMLRERVKQQTEIIRQDYERQAVLQRRFQALFENANDVVFTLDEAGRFTSLNKAGESLLGFDREEAKKKTLKELVASQDQALLADLLQPDQKGTRQRQAELHLIHRSDCPIDLEVNFRGVRESGRLMGFEAIARDLTDRKKAQVELETAQKELVHASRQAGMAEVATGVLHNVGNVLNSVNVAGQTALGLVRKLRIDSLDKVADLLAANQEKADFLRSDPKGQKLPEYLEQLAAKLGREQETVIKELNALLESVEHTKDIVAMQQAYAHSGGIRDRLSPTDLVEDALRLNAGALTRHEVTLVKDFSPTPKISVDRTRILQVLINLIRNAKYACDESRRTEKVLTVSIGESAKGVRITVADTGVGIPSENLTKIFAFGFTTRKDGHGFGLHSSALAAKEVGGELTAESDGIGHGAQFHLDLPISNEEASA